nr:immunoglobulin light chain junction region [Macaca mulatta]MOW61863.1 immunoglobulin light chain junction region [Macaca mulatta]MOW61877.1 immunoglobulin light chain junction region [Macaca mulatta]MOW61879.1 immunoglobulin light chain junction region [Macaca mulatta]MOW61932.1 immunoglobulin light chain junction region [Macaca mulatta]
CMQDIQFPLSF